MEIPPISPSSPPPVIAPPPLPPKRRGWMIFAIVLLVLLAFSLFGNLAQFVGNMLSFHNGFHTEAFASARDAGPKLEEFTLENNKSANKIAVITVDGIITSHEFDGSGNNMVDVIQAQLDRARGIAPYRRISPAQVSRQIAGHAAGAVVALICRPPDPRGPGPGAGRVQAGSGPGP